MDLYSIGFCLCLTYLLWVLAGYPLWLHWRARSCPEPLRGPAEPTVTAIIPVHNGGQFLAAKLDSVLASDYPPAKLDILVLSDASTDSTEAVARQYAAAGRVRFLSLPRGGKAAAVSTALGHVTAEVLLLTDVRQKLEPACVRRLVSRFHDPAAGVVSGNLKIRSGESSGEANTGLYWRYESWIRRNLGLIDSLLGATGPIYAMRRELARPLPAGCILDDMWLPLQAVLAGKRSLFAEDAVAWDYPTALRSEFVRKVRTQAGLYQLLKQEPRLLWPWTNRLWWPFLNLKMGRLFLPHVLIVLLASSFGLPAPWRALAGAGQALFYAIALLDGWIPETSPIKRLSGPIAAFLTLVVAAFQAQAIWFTEPGKLWKTTQVRAAVSETGTAIIETKAEGVDRAKKADIPR